VANFSASSLKDLNQNLIDRKQITFDDEPPTQNTNKDLNMYKEPFPNHGQGPNPDKGKGVNKASTSYDSIVGHFEESRVSTLTIKGKSTDCVVTTRHGRVTLRGPTPSPPTQSNYNLVEHLGKTPTQISILDILLSLPAHKAVLEKALQESLVPNNIAVTDF